MFLSSSSLWTQCDQPPSTPSLPQTPLPLAPEEMFPQGQLRGFCRSGPKEPGSIPDVALYSMWYWFRKHENCKVEAVTKSYATLSESH